MKNSFFYRLYVSDKKLFLFVAVFSGLTIFCNIRGDEITPFFVWAMYSEKEDTTNRYEIFKTLVNDSVLVDYSSGYTNDNRFLLSSPLSYYNKIKKNNLIDPTISFLQEKLGPGYATIQPVAEEVLDGREDQQMFTSWYKRYLEQTMDISIHAIKVNALAGHFTAGQQLQIDSGYFVIEWRQQ